MIPSYSECELIVIAVQCNCGLKVIINVVFLTILEQT